jgi:pimeloyl-ACP methyl ester carboxylesterase
MATFVLVHGAWHGGWCWRKVTPLLRSAGHEVFTPTLTGLGERAHLATATIDLATHSQDVVSVLEYEDLSEVVLVGHSYGGMVITDVADQAADRIAHLVYLDAVVPRDGQALLDLLPPEMRVRFEALVASEGDGWQLPRPQPVPWEVFLPQAWGVSDPMDVGWLAERLRSQPFRTLTQPVRRINPAAEQLDRTYVLCNGGIPGSEPSSTMFAPVAEAARASGWRYRELATRHEAMITTPRELTDLLLETVRAG